MKPWKYPVCLNANLDNNDATKKDFANSLAGNSVHVWFAWLADFAKYEEPLASTLSPAEKIRASKFFNKVDRERFILKRGLLRNILGAYTGLLPSQIQFNHEKNGKPFLSRLPNDRPLYFNLSQTNGVVVYAVAQGGDVGVDIEQVRNLTGWQDIVQEHFSNREQAALCSIPEARRLEAFYHGWTRKEAYLKATGQGIGDGLYQIEVSLEPDKPAEIYCIGGSTSLVEGWTITDLPTFPGFVGALVVRADMAEIRARIC